MNNNKIIHLKSPIIVRELAKQIEIQLIQLIHDLMTMNVFATRNQTITPEVAAAICKSTVILWSLPEIMSELRGKLDRGEITLDKYHASWIAQKMEENERLQPAADRTQFVNADKISASKIGSMIVDYGL
jgi:hypothetical protein